MARWLVVLLMTAAVFAAGAGSVFAAGAGSVFAAEGQSGRSEEQSESATGDQSWQAASEDQTRSTAKEMGVDGELEELEQFLVGITAGEDNLGESFSFWGLMRGIASGSLGEILGQVGQGLKGSLLYEVSQGGQMLAQVVAIGFIGAVFSNISSVFKGGQISDTGFFVTYLLLFTCLAGSFLASLRLAEALLMRILEFMRLLMPAYYMAVAFSGGSMSALALYEGMLGAVTLVQWLCCRILLPTVKIYVLLVLGDHAMREPVLTRFAELTEQAVGWSLKTLVGLVMGFHLIQSMVLPYADAVGQSGVKRLAEMIPGLGQGAGAVAQMVLGSGVLMKNTMGAATVLALAVISLVPVVKLAVLMVLYQCVAAIMQPVCDKRMVSCVSGVSKGHRLLLQMVMYSLFLFMLSIAVTCAATNANYFAA